MPFIQLDDQITEHPKILQAGAVAAWVWVSAIAYCQRQLTDGFVPAAALPRLASEATPKVIAKLIALRLIDRVDGGFLVHDYLDHNPSRVTVTRRRLEASQRKERHRGTRDGRVPERVTPTVTDAPSRVRIPTPTPTPTDPKSGSVPPALVPATPVDPQWGAMPTRRRNPTMAWEAQREGLSVPAKLHADLLSKMAPPNEVALLAWYALIEQQWQAKAVGETCWKFWNARFVEWQGATVTAKLRMAGGGASTSEPWLCRHEPRCGHRTACSLTTAKEVNAGTVRLEDVQPALLSLVNDFLDTSELRATGRTA